MFLVAAKFEFFQIRQNKSNVTFYLTSLGKYYNNKLLSQSRLGFRQVAGLFRVESKRFLSEKKSFFKDYFNMIMIKLILL